MHKQILSLYWYCEERGFLCLGTLLLKVTVYHVQTAPLSSGHIGMLPFSSRALPVFDLVWETQSTT